MIKKLFYLFICLSCGYKAVAQTRVYVNEYLNIGVGARALGMGGSVAATVNDATAGYWNPAGLMGVKSDVQLVGMHAEYFAGNSKYDYLGLAVPLKNKHRVLGFSAFRFATDDIAYTLDYIQPDGSFDDSKLKSISAGDYAFLLSYAQDLNFKKKPNLHTRLGVNAKILYRNIGSMANAWGAGLDIGLQSSFGKWRFGLMAKDITTTYTAWSFHLTDHEKQVFGETHNAIPVKSYEIMTPRLNFGIGRYFTPAKSAFQFLVEADGDITTDGRRNTLIGNADLSLDPHAGIELSFKGLIYLRLGVSNFQRVLDDKDTTNQAKYTLWQPSAGAGIRISTLTVDYSYTSLQTQSNPLYSHIISAKLDLRSNKSKHNKSPEAPSPADKPKP